MHDICGQIDYSLNTLRSKGPYDKTAVFIFKCDIVLTPSDLKVLTITTP